MKPAQQIAFREYYETLLAEGVLQNPNIVPAVKKVSYAILDLINKNKEILHTLTKESMLFEEEMYHPSYFGKLGKEKNTCNTPIKTIQELENILISSSPLEVVMHAHALFMAKFYDKLPIKTLSTPVYINQSKNSISYSQKVANSISLHPDKITDVKNQVVKDIFYNELFFKDTKIDRPRLDLNFPIKPTRSIGIVRNHFFQQITPQGDDEHIRAADKFMPDFTSNNTRQADQLNLPIVAGPSGHAGSLILTAIMCGNLSQEEMMEYGLAINAYLIAGGNHAFHETACVLEKVGIPYKPGEYTLSLPQSFKTSVCYSKIIEKIDELFNDYVQQKLQANITINKLETKKLYHQFTGKELTFDLSNNGTCYHQWDKFDATEDRRRSLDQYSLFSIHSKNPAFTQCSAISSVPTINENQYSITAPQNWLQNTLTLGLVFATKLGIFSNNVLSPINNHLIDSIKNEDSARKTLNKHNMTLDTLLEDLCGKNNIRKKADKCLLVKKMIIKIINGEAKGHLKTKIDEIILINQNRNVRFKELVKLARKEFHVEFNIHPTF